MIPDNLKYTRDHEWVRVENGEAVVGITDHAQKELGDIVFLELPEPGRQLRAGDEMGTVESVKAVSEIFAPVSGEVVAVNGDLTENPDNAAVVNRDPYGAGWMVRIRVAPDADVSALLDAAGYRSYLEESGD